MTTRTRTRTRARTHNSCSTCPLDSNIRSSFPQGLRGFFLRSLIPHVVPQIGARGVFLQEPPGRILTADSVDDALTQQHLLLFGERDVKLLVGRYQHSPVRVAHVIVRSSSPSAENVVGMGLRDGFQRVRHGQS